MDISKINTTVLRSLIKLTEKRDALLAELKKIDTAIAAAYGGKAAPSAPASAKVKPAAKAPAKKAKSGKRGALKAKIIATLRAAGDKGVGVKDISKKLGVKNQNIHVWFSSTGKKLGVIQKVGAGKYRLKPGA